MTPQNGWIPCSEKMPEDLPELCRWTTAPKFTTVMVAGRYKINALDYSKELCVEMCNRVFWDDEWNWSSGNIDPTYFKVEYWTPLPEPPEKE